MGGADRTPRQPHQRAATKAAKEAREARLAKAMRDNLRKRRQQQAARGTAESSDVKPS